MEPVISQVRDMLAEPMWMRLALAVVILVVGWVVAMALAAITRRVLSSVRLNDRIAPKRTEEDGSERPSIDLERLVTQIVFYVLMLFVLVAFFQQMQISAITEPLNALLTTLMQDYLPRIMSAGAILLVAWIAASLLRFIVLRAAEVSKIEERLTRQAELGDDQPLSMAPSLATAAYWLVFLLFLPAVFGQLEMAELAQPIELMTTRVLLFLPSAFAAGLILVFGWLLARIARQVITNLASALGVDALGQRAGLFGDQPLSALLGTISYAIVIILVAIQALTALGIATISEPAINMLNSAFQAIPRLTAAGLLLFIAYYAGKLVAGLATSVLQGLGFDQLPERLGVDAAAVPGQKTPSQLAGVLILLGIVLFAASEAAALLQFGSLALTLDQVIAFGGQLVLALIVLAIGVYLANLAHNAVRSTGGENTERLASATRAVVIVLVTAMALEQVGVGQEIVRDAFRALVFAIAGAAALAFGLGGRDSASAVIDRWLASAKGKPPSAE